MRLRLSRPRRCDTFAMVGSLALADFRRRVADNYAHARAGGPGPAAWMAWRMRRDEIFRDHPESPVPPAARRGFSGMAFFPYDPTWRLEATVIDAPGNGAGHEPAGLADAGARFRRLGDVVAQRGDHEIRLPLMWLDAYGGGLFLPFRDGTNGSGTYGGGRYLLDQVKGADLGATPDGRLVLDFNYAYHPSCAHDTRWTCPLAPPDAVIPVPVRAGEMLPGTAA